ncbi:MAG: hypothetical protein IKF50_06505 [Clostridia bacterium]|nr:hypothetical protein [Clostridia bacterium]
MQSGNEKILPMRKDHALLKKQAQRYADQEKLEQAASCAVKAVRADYSDRESRYLLAQIYRMMERFRRSNDILATLTAQRSQDEADYWYMMGCNYADMQMLGSARDCLRMCLAMEPDPVTQEDAEDLLEPLREYYEGDEEDRTMWLLQQTARRGARLLEAHRLEEAAAVLRYVDMVEPLFMDTRNYYSRLLWRTGSKKDAVSASEWVLARYPKDVYALCNLAFYAYSDGDAASCSKYLKRLTALSFDRDMEAADDLLEVARTLYRCGEYSQALEYARRYRALCRYEEEGMHLEAATRFMLGQTADAQKIWTQMCRIDDMDAAADYYRRVCIRRLKQGDGPVERIPCRHGLEKETLRKLIRRYVPIPGSKAETAGAANDPAVLALLYESISRGIMMDEVLPVVAADRSEETLDILYGMLMRDVSTVDQIRWLCAAVQMRCGDTACFVDHEDAVNSIMLKGTRPVPSQRERDLMAVRALFFAGTEGVLSAKERKEALVLLREFSGRLHRWYPVHSPEAFAAALEYYYCTRTGADADKHLCIKRYGTDTKNFNQALARLVRVLARPEE